MKLFTIILFAITYILMIALPKKRPYVALISAVIFVVSGAMPLGSVFSAIDWNVLLMLAGTMGTVALFIESKMPERMADLLLQKTPNVMWVAVALSVFAGVVSAFVDNVATVLMIAPVALSIAKKLKISPVALLICIAVSSNLQGAATLVGDTTSIMLGGYANMDFLDFIVLDGKCSIFFAVELGALVTVPVIMFIFRKEKGKVTVGAPTAVEDLFPTWLLCGTGGVRRRKKVHVKVPAGIDNGQAISVRGQGDRGRNGGPAGDLIVGINVTPHPRLRREGPHIYLDQTVSILQATLGGEVEIPSLDGKIMCKIEPGTQPGTTLRLRGRGVPSLNGRGRGDQYVTIRVEIPRNLNEEQKDALRKFAATMGEHSGVTKSEEKDEHGSIFHRKKKK